MPAYNDSPLRSFDEIYHAHDMCIGLLLDEVPEEFWGGFDPREKAAFKTVLNCIANTLCWVLRHDHNTETGDLLKNIEALLAASGVVMMKEKAH